MNKNLVIGGSGLVGSHITSILQENGSHHISTYNKNPCATDEQLDITQESAVWSIFERYKPDVVFLPAGQTNVEYCESNQEETYNINVAGVENIVNACNGINARLVYFSTDYVFDGKFGPYDEDALVNPINEYGRQKLAAEHHILMKSSNFLIVRTTIVFGWEPLGKNFIYRLIQSIKAGRAVKIPIDQVGTPTYAPYLAKCAIELSAMNIKGFINIAGSNCINRYEFAIEAAKVFNLPQDHIIPVPTNELHQTAARPLLAGLKTEKVKSLLKTSLPTSSEGLSTMSKEVQQDLNIS